MTKETNQLLVEKAISYAKEKHKGQTRSTREDYFENHVYKVYELCKKFDRNNVTLHITALLHDTLEDTKATESEILEMFGSDVLFNVKALTLQKTKNWFEKHNLLSEKAKTYNEVCQIVKIFDRICNVYDGEKCWDDLRILNYLLTGCVMIVNMQKTNNRNIEELKICTRTFFVNKIISCHERLLH